MTAIFSDARDTDRVLDDAVNQSLAHGHRHFAVRIRLCPKVRSPRRELFTYPR